MAVTVTPQAFTFVSFEAPAIEALLTGLLDRLGMADRSLQVEINEASPVVRIVAEDGDPIVIRADSGAFEEPRRPGTPAPAGPASGPCPSAAAASPAPSSRG